MAEGIDGLDNLIEGLKSLSTIVPQLTAAALYQEALPIAEICQERCPVAPSGTTDNPGELKASIRVEDPIIEGEKISVAIVCGGPGMEGYSVAVHEHISPHDPPSWKKSKNGVVFNTGGPKFMEGPVMEASPGLSEKVGVRVGAGIIEALK